MTALSSVTQREGMVCGLPRPPLPLEAAPGLLPGCWGRLSATAGPLRLIQRRFLRSWWASLLPAPLGPQGGNCEKPVPLLWAGRRHPINQSINSKQMRTSCFGWNPDSFLPLP